ncbi:3'-5' exonuclease [Parasedimentitalea psychrophila]|uniref:3'-5' exonuclease n=2 Tax=Parasedimentitalea psychrophila TaxID=2997337 RepID=A0A9Y2KYT0_9RHOB|nr:3'-5' exonuclease [Parasedimentitalea psychrophila]WIY23884.1 3'-5' exonuclease [Parasedimentitalea psychrophila]WIY24516.1 3'-5' exonuclease [Parasedimentitalea psychrophila]
MTDALPHGDFRFIALDVETSCGDSASICQIGLACVGLDRSIQTWSAFVDPLMPFAPFNVELHGISAKTVENAPTFAEIWPKLQVLLTRHAIVQHSRFDEHAINAACKAHGLYQPRLSWSNSVTIARTAWPGLKGNGGHGLANLKQHLSLEFQHHDAGEDARAAALVVLRAEVELSKPFEQITSNNTAFQLSFSF